MSSYTIIQISPASQWCAIYEGDTFKPLVCWALLTVAGHKNEVHGMVLSEDKNIVPANTLEGFVAYDMVVDELEIETDFLN